MASKRTGAVGIEYVSPEGLRLDGRRPGEIRRLRAAVGVEPAYDGSATFQMGNTLVVATVRGPAEGVGSGSSASATSGASGGAARVFCDYEQAPFSTKERRRRPRDRATTELGATIARVLEGVVQLQAYPPRACVHVCVRVVQNDGGARACALNAAVLACVDAGVPLADVVCACGAGVIDGTPVLDTSAAEEAAGGADVALALLARTGRVAMLETDARLPADVFRAAVALASTGTQLVYTQMCTVLRTAAAEALAARGSVAPKFSDL